MIDVLNRNEFQFLFRFLWNIDQIFFVQLRNDDGGNAGPHRAQTFFFQPANWENESAQSDLTGHGDIGTHGSIAEKRSERGEHGDAGGRSIFRHGAGGNVHMDVVLAKFFRLRPDLIRARTHETKRGLHRFFHYFADLTGEDDVPFAGITGRFDIENFATVRRVSQSRDHARFARGQFCFANVLGRPERLRHDFGRDGDRLSFAARKSGRNRPADRADLPLEFAHTSFVRVIVDHTAKRFVLPLTLLGLESVFLQLSSNQITFRDLEFLAFGVTG